jgi:saccharopine dehydrogenase (NAD+, L-lysine-forming)
MDARDDASADRWLLYGAYGYSGELVARRAVARGMRPVLAGRDARRLERVARELDCEHRVLALDDPGELAAALDDVALVAHCAGPFSRTSRPMVDACIASGTSYLDITGELDVLRDVLGRDAEARAAGISLLPGSGFDVVPSDCLAAITAEELERPVRSIELAIRASGGVSGGTARTAAEQIGEPALCVRGGELVPVPRAERRQDVTYATRTIASNAVSLGDLVTAQRSTGASDVTVRLAMPAAASASLRVVDAASRVPGAARLLRRVAGAAAGRMGGPDARARERGRSEVWCRATAADGTSVERRLVAPSGYALTADAVVRIAEAVLAGRVDPGAHTPSQGLGTRFALELDGVSLQ